MTAGDWRLLSRQGACRHSQLQEKLHVTTRMSHEVKTLAMTSGSRRCHNCNKGPQKLSGRSGSTVVSPHTTLLTVLINAGVRHLARTVWMTGEE